MVRAFAIARIAMGAAAFIAPKTSARLFAFPLEHDNASARTMGRLFGVRDFALGVLALRYASEPAIAPTLNRVNAFVDAGDATAAAIVLLRREGIDRAALGVFALGTTAAAVGAYLAANSGTDPVADPGQPA